MNKPTEMDLLKRENRELKKNVQTLKNENSDLKSEIAQGRDLFKKTKKSFPMVLITLILKLFSDGKIENLAKQKVFAETIFR